MSAWTRRKVQSREPRNIVLIVIEGETERRYFDALRQRDSNVEIIMVKPGPTDPIKLMDACIYHVKEKEMDLSQGDVAICVFDIDENPSERIMGAIDMAADAGIIMAISNPCFELWLALHFQEVHHKITRREAFDLVNNHIANYSKTGDYREILIPRRQLAMARSEKLQKENTLQGPLDYSKTNPSSSMNLALKEIDVLIKRNRSKRGRPI